MSDVAQRITGPFPIRGDDLGGLNVLFSDAFSERYRRDGMAGVRVPPLNPAIWRFAIEGAGDGGAGQRVQEVANTNLAAIADGRQGDTFVPVQQQRFIGRELSQLVGVQRQTKISCPRG